MILNDAPYGDERCYNALRLAHALHKHDPGGELTVFLMADSVLGGKAGQSTPGGYYNVEHMLNRILSGGGRVLLCGSCMNARGLLDDELLAGAARSTMDELAAITLATDKVVVF
ncbi:MAG: DsrE family protein [Hyphomonadaceae bacterium]|nr:DsrE family protein [Hyphomonadaceae bacterium]